MSDMTDTATANIPVWTLGDRLRKSREWIDLTQEDMAARLGKSRAAIAGWENDKHRPDTLAMRAWAHETQIPLWWLDGSESEADFRSRCFSDTPDLVLSAA